MLAPSHSVAPTGTFASIGTSPSTVNARWQSRFPWWCPYQSVSTPRSHPAKGSQDCGAALTAPELSVLRALSLGLQLSDIAEQLELKEETIRSHLKTAEGKLGVHDRCHAVAQAIRESLIF